MSKKITRQFLIIAIIATRILLAPDASLGAKLAVNVPDKVNFPNVAIDAIADAGAQAKSVAQIKIKDDRPKARGWAVTATCSNFSDEFGDVLPVSNLTIIPQAILALEGSAEGIIVGPEHTFLSPADSTLLASAPSGFGSGLFRQDEILRLFVDVATRPGKYQGTLTMTII